jgi:RNA polymerase sigma-70 factor (ECF subfamily)
MSTKDVGERSGLLERAASGDASAVRALFAGYRERLRRLVHLRLSRQLAGRLNQADVVEDILAEAMVRLKAYADGPSPDLSLWLRDLGCRKLAEIHHLHLGAADDGGGTVGPGELTLHGGGLPVLDPASLAAQLMGGARDESPAAARAEARLAVQEALNSMEPIDREVLALKHFERLSFGEIARVLGLTEAGAGRRYLEAIKRLKGILPWDLGSGHSRREV